MSLHVLRERLRAASSDDRITDAEVRAWIRAAESDGSVNEMEAFLLASAMDAWTRMFEPDALETLRAFVESAKRRRAPR